MKKSTLLLWSIAVFSTIAGCQSPAGQSPRLEQLESRVASLETKIESLEQSASQQVAENSESPEASSTPAATPTSPAIEPSPASGENALWKTLDFANLPSPEVLKEITSLGFLPKAGITDQTGLEGELTRGQYVALLVEMNNLLQEPNQRIRLAREGDGQAFDDVSSSHPYYKYIQGMVDAGYVIGFNEKSFQPDKTLTREEMVAIAAKRDFDFNGLDSKYYWDNYAPFTDKNDIAPKYRDAVAKDYGETTNSNLRQAFGELKLFHPKKTVKVFEAILSLQGVGGYSTYRYEEKVSEALGSQP